MSVIYCGGQTPDGIERPLRGLRDQRQFEWGRPVVDPTIPVELSTISRNCPMTRGTDWIRLTSSWALNSSRFRFRCSSLMYSSYKATFNVLISHFDSSDYDKARRKGHAVACHNISYFFLQAMYLVSTSSKPSKPHQQYWGNVLCLQQSSKCYCLQAQTFWILVMCTFVFICLKGHMILTQQWYIMAVRQVLCLTRYKILTWYRLYNLNILETVSVQKVVYEA